MKRSPRIAVRRAVLAVGAALCVMAVSAGPSQAASSCPITEDALQSLIGTSGTVTVTLSCPTDTTIPFTTPITINRGENVTLDASGSPGAITFDGGGSTQLFVLQMLTFGSGLDGGILTLNKLTLANAHTGEAGAAVDDEGTLTATDTTFLDNSSVGSNGGAVFIGGNADATITGSSFVGNSSSASGALGGGGGAIATDTANGSVMITNSTFTGNSAGGGGAILQEGRGGATIVSSTLAGNTASDSSTAGGIYADEGSATISASIVANNTPANCNSGAIVDNGYNLEDDSAASCTFSTADHDIVGKDPNLGPVDNDGGPTATMPLLAGSPAIDQIPLTTHLCPATDQRGAPRPGQGKTACDIGAYEAQPMAPPFVYWTNTQAGTVGRGTADGNPFTVDQDFVNPGNSRLAAYSVAVDGKYIYWTNNDGIGRANLDGSDPSPSFIPDTFANHIAVDGKHIYWTASGGAVIGRANLDGSDATDTFITGLGSTGELAVDGRYIYWSDAGNRTIGRADLDGSGVNDNFITVPHDVPFGLAVDYQHIYWTGDDSIGRANLDGSGVDDQFITGLYDPGSVAVDYQHIYWESSFDFDFNPSRGGGYVGRANLDGSGVNQTMITADDSVGLGCNLSPVSRCGPRGVAVTPPSGPDCLRTATPPLPPAAGAVFARPMDSNSQDANVVVLPAGSTWKGDASCAGLTQGADEVMTHPSSIAVASGGAVLLRDATSGLASAWGAQNVAGGGPAPVLYPGTTLWTTNEAQVVSPQTLLTTLHGCPDCSLANVNFKAGPPISDVAYERDLSGADLSGATLSGNLAGWNLTADLAGATLSGADLTGATLTGAILTQAVLDHTMVSGAVFDGADLRGAQLTALQFAAPPSFQNVRVGAINGGCTRFQDTYLVGANLTPLKPDAGCGTNPLLPGSTVPVTLLYLLTHTDQAQVDYDGARFVIDGHDRTLLAGLDLSGIHLNGASFLGFPGDFEKTNFNGAWLQQASFELADLAGATLEGVHAAGASFEDANLNGATLSGGNTDLEGTNFVNAVVSGATFLSADLGGAQPGSGADFSHALAKKTSFNSVTATNAVFSGAHIYGDGDAFDSARDMDGVDFSNALLAGSLDGSGGFNLTDAKLTNAKFDGAQCVACNFTGSTLNGAAFSGAYLPGATFSGATLDGAHLDGAWLYCGPQNDSCPPDANSSSSWNWPLDLAPEQETYGPVPFSNTNLNGVSLNGVTACPDGTNGRTGKGGCVGHLIPNGTLTVPLPCSSTLGRPDGRGAAALEACATQTSTLFDATKVGSPVSIAAEVPPTWATSLDGRGYYVGFDDGTIRAVSPGAPAQLVAGSPGRQCSDPTAACGDGGQATSALLGLPSGLAVGLDGSLYIADPTLHRVRRIDPSGKISTIAGTGQACDPTAKACGDGGQATVAKLAGPYGVWVGPSGDLYIADGRQGIREVLPDGLINNVGIAAGAGDVRSVVGDGFGNLYAATTNPDYLVYVDVAKGQATNVVGTGTSGFNGDTDSLGDHLPGTQVQINDPQSLSVGLGGDVVFADTGNDLIRAYVPQFKDVIDLGGLVSDDGTPQGGSNGDGKWADQTELNHPAAVTVTTGALFVVADTGNHSIREIGPKPSDAQLLKGTPGPKTPTRTLIVCQTAIKWVGRGRQRRRVNATTCSGERASQTATLHGGDRAMAALERGGVNYATGTSVITSSGRRRLLVTDERTLLLGRYTLVLRQRRDGRWVVHRMSIALF